jgi:hypothetical protein
MVLLEEAPSPYPLVVGQQVPPDLAAKRGVETHAPEVNRVGA